MNTSKARFAIHLKKTEKLLASAATHESPSLWLFINDLRTPLFKLEALCRVYKNIQNKKTFQRYQAKFKAAEDALGAVDYYVTYQKEFAKNKNILTAVKQHFEKKKDEKLKQLAKLLQKEGWLNGKLLTDFTKKLEDICWKNEEKVVKKIKKLYKKEIDSINDFMSDTNYVFTDIEAHTHEFRRKLRWLSIYPQALNGLVSLQESKTTAAYFKKYLTPQIVSSPYNQLQAKPKAKHILVLDKNHFLALSWLIAELGLLKDAGQKIHALQYAIQEVNLLNDADSAQKAMQILGTQQPSQSQILARSSEITRTFIVENILEGLVRG
jgi:hypothetical protein